MISNSNRGKLITTLEELITMADNKESVYVSAGNYRSPAAVIVQWSLLRVHQLLSMQCLYHYISTTKKSRYGTLLKSK